MKLSEAKLKCAANYFEFVEIRRNPAAIEEFIAWPREPTADGQPGKN
jgi:hypothetical protein